MTRLTPDDHQRISEIVFFWRNAGFEKWFSKDEAFDAEFRGRFLDDHFAAARRARDHWTETAEGTLALLLLLDQLPRNCFRGTGHMYATDPLALHFALEALNKGFDQMVEKDLRLFFYLPLSHSENLALQERAVELNRAIGEETTKHAINHRDIVKRFGRFPHRNPVLGRATTLEEQKFLDEGGFKG
jgi:uncharacterized protein (DUF924 family)